MMILQEQLAQLGISEPAAVAVAALLGAALVAAVVQPCRQRSNKDDDEDSPQVAWGWFCVSNLLAMAGFIGSISYLLTYWQTHATDHAAAFAFMQPPFIVSLVIALASVLYLFAFFGVAFVHKDVTDLMKRNEREASREAALREPRWSEADADVVIVGLGLAGSALATVLSRQGKRVVVIERSKELYETIKGELLQPGGVRALERMGLADTCKKAEVDPVRVDGYVCIRPGASGPEGEIVLSYPNRDPKGWLEYLGWWGSSAKKPQAMGSGTGETEVYPVTNEDVHPRGRSFHNVRFVQQLRQAAAAEPNVKILWGTVKRLVTAKDAAGQAAKGGKDMPGWTADPDRVVGVTWVPIDGPESERTERTAVAPLTIVADGMWSTLRASVHTNTPRTVSHFCGLMLKHAPAATPLPYPNRGHVIMADPNPVLFYQISSTETRVLVDVPGKLWSDDMDKLKEYFRGRVAPQLPQCLQEPFLKACDEQEPYCMPNRALTGAAPTKKGVVMVGDTLNMRHPLTGGGMTVALKDVELLSNCMRALSFGKNKYSEKTVEQAIARFSERRAAHAATINILANALHRVFTKPLDDDGTRERLRDACVHYLGVGGVCSAGPVGLLSGLTPKPNVLVMHFFAVAAHAMRMALLPFPTPRKVREGYDLLHIACIIIMPLLQAEGVTFLSNGLLAGAIHLLFPWKGVDPATL